MAEQQWPADGTATVVAVPAAQVYDPQIAYLGKGVILVATVEFVCSLALIIVSAINAPPPSEPTAPNGMTSAIACIVNTILVCLCAYVGVMQSNKCCLCCYGIVQILWGLGNLGFGCLCFCVFGTLLATIEAAAQSACDSCKQQGNCTCNQADLDALGGVRGALQIIGIIFMLMGCFGLLGGYFGCALQSRIQEGVVVYIQQPKGAPTHQKAVQG